MSVSNAMKKVRASKSTATLDELACEVSKELDSIE